MELSTDLIGIQGILIGLLKNTGEFTKINYRGGNEEKILTVMKEIQKFIVSKNYVKDEQINSVFDKQLEDIVFFLAVNTIYKKPLKLEEYAHVMNIMPQLSKCLLVNIVYGLDLCKYYCTVIEKLPVDFTIELLEEMIPCLKKSVPKLHLKYACMFLKAVANKLTILDYSKQEDNIDNISEVTNIMLMNLTGLYTDQLKNWKTTQIYQHMGYTLLNLFELLLYCDKENLVLKQFIANLLGTCCSIVRNVTVHVFCAWAEIEQDDQHLQSIISGKAYLVVENYQGYKEAKELINMLSTIAKKPKTLKELICEADISTIINKINKNDQDQRSWFQALLSTDILKNREGITCLNKWVHLCNEDDVARLLDLSVRTADVETKKIVVKCAAMLHLEKLYLVLTRHFYKHKFSGILDENVQPQLTLLFNKINKLDQKDIHKEITLLILQNPAATFTYIYSECLKNTIYTSCFKGIFSNIKEISKIDDLGIQTLNSAISKNTPDLQNINNYIELFTLLLDVKCFSKDAILLKVLFPLLEQYFFQEQFEELNCTLQILLDGKIRIAVKEEHILELLLYIMSTCRCQFLNFNNIKQENTKYVIEIFTNLCDRDLSFTHNVNSLADTEDFFINYYKNYLSLETDISCFFSNLFPNFNINNYAECVCLLLQFLPSLVTKEWLMAAEGILKLCGIEKCMELVSDVMILLCQLVETQEFVTNIPIFAALKYCLQNFGIIIQQMQQNSTINEEVIINKQVCRLLRRLPDYLKEEEGLRMINILTERSLKSLVPDKEFMCLLISINNAEMCKALAQKMTN